MMIYSYNFQHPLSRLVPPSQGLGKGYRDPFFPVIRPDFPPIRKYPAFRALFKLSH
jgi:hypothetical protein